MATRKRKKNTGLGIAPIVAAAATKAPDFIKKVEDTETGRRVLKTTTDTADYVTHSVIDRFERRRKRRRIIGGVLLGTLAIYAGVKTYQAIRRNNLMKKGLSSPEVGAAIKIWNAVPDGFKAHWGGFSVLNPFSSVANALTSIKQLWQDVNTQSLFDAAKYMHDNNLNVTKVSRHFKMLYKIDLVDFLNDVLDTAQYETFNNLIKSGEATKTPTPQGKNENGQLLYAVTKDNCYVRTTAECNYTQDPFKLMAGLRIPNGVQIEGIVDSKVPANTIVGQWTGVSEYYESQYFERDESCYLSMMNAIRNGNGKVAALSSINHYIAKSQVYPEGFTVDDLRSKFGSSMKALVYDSTTKKYKLTTISLNN